MSLVGAVAPDFELLSQHGASVRLSSLRGAPVVLVFYPFAFTGMCTRELTSIRDDLVPSVEARARVLAVSCDSIYTLRVFADTQDLGFPLLSDFWPHGRVATAYDVFDDERGCAVRGTFVIDASGVVRWEIVNAIADPRSVAEYERVLGGLSAA